MTIILYKRWYCIYVEQWSKHVGMNKWGYWFILYVVSVSASPLSGNFLFSRFPFLLLLLMPKSLHFTLISRATWGSTRGIARGARWGGGEGGGPHVARKRLQPCTCWYLGVKFNLPSLFTIPGPILAPFPAGDWVSNLRGSSVSRTLQWKLQCFRLPTPVLAKGVLTFSLPWLDSIEIARLGLLPIVFCSLKEQMARNVSVSCDSGYCAYLSWSFPTWPGVMSLARTFMYLGQHHQAWRQRWCQLNNPINFGSSRPPVCPGACHYPDVSLSRIWNGPDALGVRRV